MREVCVNDETYPLHEVICCTVIEIMREAGIESPRVVIRKDSEGLDTIVIFPLSGEIIATERRHLAEYVSADYDSAQEVQE